MSIETIRILIFLALIVTFWAAQSLWPRRQDAPWKTRLVSNLGIFGLGALLSSLLGFMAASVASVWAQANGVGAFNLISAPSIAAIIASFILLDLAIWGQHVASHKVPLLWRFHRMHHSDIHVDVTTALRFHPIEIAASLMYKAAIVIVIGAPLIGVIIFEIVLNGAAMFNHSNINLPKPIDRILRRFIVTPDMHRVHHSSHEGETNSNYGFCISLWDRIFKTYIDQPKNGHKRARLGLCEFRDEADQTILALLVLPARPKTPQ